jgi:hypothetical protein
MNVVKLDVMNLRDSVEGLRRLANRIEAGEYGEVNCCAVALLADQLTIYSWGPHSQGPATALLFQAANQRFVQEVLG